MLSGRHHKLSGSLPRYAFSPLLCEDKITSYELARRLWAIAQGFCVAQAADGAQALHGGGRDP